MRRSPGRKNDCKSAANMSRVPDHLKAYQEKAFELLQKELRALEDLAERSNI